MLIDKLITPELTEFLNPIKEKMAGLQDYFITNNVSILSDEDNTDYFLYIEKEVIKLSNCYITEDFCMFTLSAFKVPKIEELGIDEVRLNRVEGDNWDMTIVVSNK